MLGAVHRIWRALTKFSALSSDGFSASLDSAVRAGPSLNLAARVRVSVLVRESLRRMRASVPGSGTAPHFASNSLENRLEHARRASRFRDDEGYSWGKGEG